MCFAVQTIFFTILLLVFVCQHRTNFNMEHHRKTETHKKIWLKTKNASFDCTRNVVLLYKRKPLK